jgi:hypothetical protein
MAREKENAMTTNEITKTETTTKTRFLFELIRRVDYITDSVHATREAMDERQRELTNKWVKTYTMIYLCQPSGRYPKGE